MDESLGNKFGRGKYFGRGVFLMNFDVMGIKLLSKCDRVPNEMNDISGFIDANADVSHIANSILSDTHTTKSGSINEDGIECSFQARSLTPFNKLFYAGIEPRIKPLVRSLNDIGLITYTSCEGHLIDGKIYEAHIGILVTKKRCIEHCLQIIDLLEELNLNYYSHELTDTEFSIAYPTIEIYFPYMKKSQYESYEREVERKIRMATQLLEDAVGKRSIW